MHYRFRYSYRLPDSSHYAVWAVQSKYSQFLSMKYFADEGQIVDEGSDNWSNVGEMDRDKSFGRRRRRGGMRLVLWIGF